MSILNFLKPKPKSINGIKRGDWVKVTNDGQVYTCYTQVARRLKRIDQLHWDYRGFPNKDHKFTVIDILNHELTDSYDKGTVVIAIRDNMTSQVYLINELGVELLEKGS